MRRASGSRMIIMVSCLALCFLVAQQAALAQPCVWGNDTPARVWAITDIRHIGSLNMSQDYSHAYSGKNVSEQFTHSFRVNTQEGKTHAFDLLRITPVTRGSRLRAITSVGYDPLNTTRQLTGSEATSVGISYTGSRGLCQPSGYLCTSTGSQFALDRGVVQSSVSTNSPMSLVDYGFSSLGEGAVSAGSAATTGSLTYNQLITAEGEFDFFYGAKFRL